MNACMLFIIVILLAIVRDRWSVVDEDFSPTKSWRMSCSSNERQLLAKLQQTSSQISKFVLSPFNPFFWLPWDASMFETLHPQTEPFHLSVKVYLEVKCVVVRALKQRNKKCLWPDFTSSMLSTSERTVQSLHCVFFVYSLNTFYKSIKLFSLCLFQPRN